MNYADGVKESTTVTSTGTITLGGAVTGFRTCASAFPIGATEIPFSVSDSVNWENGLYTLTDAVTLTRTSILSSSNSNAAVTFPAGTKTVSCTLAATQIASFMSSDDIAFSASVPLNSRGVRYMPQQTVSSVIAFTVAAGPIKNSSVYVRLVADGTNAPTFTGFKEWGGSMGYDNRSGIDNQIQFFYDGYDYWYSISQAVNAVPVDIVAPTASSAAVANSTPTVVNITMSEALDSGFVPAASAFTVSGHTVSSAAISGSTINLTVSAAFVNGEAARTVSYTQPGTNNARDAAGNLLASFASLSITNNVAAPDVTAPAFSSAQVANAAPTVIVITFNETLAAFTPAASAFAVSGGKTVSSVSRSGATISLTCSAAYANGDTITVTYTKPGTNPIQDAAGNQTASFGPSSVTNNISAAFGRMTALDHLAETGTGPYTYTISGASGFGTSGGICTLKLQSGVDGSLAVTNANTGELIIGPTTSSTTVAFGSLPACLYAGATYLPITNGSIGTATNSVTPAAGDIMRIRRTGTSLIGEVARTATPTTFTTIFTWTGVSTAALFIEALVNTGASFSNVTTSGLA